jgi:hypothetical protein
MNANLHPALAAALLPFAPPQSVVHQIVNHTPPVEAYRALGACLDAAERRDMHRMVNDQNSYIERTGGLL